MFFPYKLNLPVNTKVDPISKCLIILFFIGFSINFFETYDPINLLAPFLLILLVKGINAGNNGVFYAKYDRASKELKSELAEIEASNVKMGLSLESDYLLINGLIPSIMSKSRASDYNFSISRKIYYRDISDIQKTKTTVFLDFRDSSGKNKFANERIFLNYHFEDYETLYSELKKRIN